MNLKHLSHTFLTIIFFFTTLISFATEPTANKENSTSTTNKYPQILLYASNNNEKIIDKLSPTAYLIKIFEKDGWIKVGNPQNGEVGWINQKQYQQAINAFNKPNIQTIFISQTVDKNNKPQMNIVAYKNGKPVSQEEADTLYKEMQKQQVEQEKYWNQFNQNIYRWQQRMWQEFAQNSFFQQPIFMPIPVVVDQKESKKVKSE